MFTHSIQRTYNDGITNIGGVETVTADSTRNFDGRQQRWRYMGHARHGKQRNRMV
jgi:hypothetical protein